MSKTDNPFTHETDNLTGERLTPAKTYEDLSGKEKAGIIVPKEYGTAEVKESGEGENKTFKPIATIAEKKGGLVIDHPIDIDTEGKTFTDKAKAQAAADKALAQHYYENGMYDGLKPLVIPEAPKVKGEPEKITQPIELSTDLNKNNEKAPTEDNHQPTTESNQRVATEEESPVIAGLNQESQPTAKAKQEVASDEGRENVVKDVELKEGQKVGARLNLNIRKATGENVLSIHDKSYHGKVLGHKREVVLKNVRFSVNENAAHKIAVGESSKFPMASVDGEYVDTNNYDKQGVEVFFNPKNNKKFVDAEGKEVESAANVTLIGNKVYARGIKYANAEAESGDYGYHGGNLKEKSDYLLSHYRGDMPFTGHYFFSDIGRAEARGNRSTGEKEIRVVDFSKYNLLKPTTGEYWAIKAGLKRFEDRLLRNDGDVKAAFNSLEDWGGLKDGAPKLYKEIVANRSKLEDVSKQWYEALSSQSGRHWEMERLETLLLKALGYEGVDVRGLKEENGEASPDSASHGSVIFDIKPNTIVNDQPTDSNTTSPTESPLPKEATLPQGQENQSTVSGHPEPTGQGDANAAVPVLDDKGVTALHQSLGDKAFSEVLDQAIEESKGEKESGVVFRTHKGEEVSGKRLTDAINKVADDLAENARAIRKEDAYASHVTEKQKDDDLAKGLEYAEAVRRGENIHNLTIAQRIDYELTGESVPILPKSNIDVRRGDKVTVLDGEFKGQVKTVEGYGGNTIYVDNGKGEHVPVTQWEKHDANKPKENDRQPLTDHKQSTSTAAGESKTVISSESTGAGSTSPPQKESSPQAPPVSQTTGAEPTAAKPKPAGKYEAKARQVAEKIKASNIGLPDFLKANLPEGTTGAGYSAEDLKNALADAVITTGKLLDKGAALKEAIKEAVKDLVQMQGKDNEATILKGFEGYYRQHFIEDEPPTAAPKEEGGNDYTHINKAALKEDYGFTKNFESKSDQSVANEAMRKLHERAADNGITPQQQAANEVVAMKHKTGEASEHDIVTAAYHLMNLDEQISKVKDDFTEGLLLQQREDALTTLRQLGNNAGRNLRLFSVAYKKVAEGAIETTRRQLRRDLGIEELPKTVKDLEKSNLTAADKKKVRPYVQTIEQLEKDLKDINKKGESTVKDIDDNELQEAIKKAYEQGKKEGQSFGNNKKKSDKLRDFAKKIRESDTLDKLGLGKSAAGDAQANGFSFNAKEALAKTIELIADGMDKVEAIAKALKESGAKASTAFNDLVDTALTKLSLRDKEEVAGDIKALAASEQSTTITKEMVQQNLIYDFVKQHIFSDTPYEQVIKNATEELKQYLPDVNEKTVADAFVKRGEFKPETRQQVQTEMKAKEGDVKRLALSELKLRALEAANDIHNIQNDTRLSAEEKKKAIEARKSTYEKGVDDKIKAIEEKKARSIENAKQAKAEYRKLETERNRQLAKVQALKEKIANYQKGKYPESTKKTTEPDTPEIEALKAQAKEEEKKLNEMEAAQRKLLRQSLAEQDAIYSLEQEGKRVKAEKTIFANATKSPKKASDALTAARKQMQQAYSEAGIRPEKQNKKDIQIYKEAEDAIKEIEQNSALTDDVKKEHIAKITADRDAQLDLTKQGVLINLKTAIDSHVADLADRIKTAKADGDTEAAQHLQDIAKDLSDMSHRLKPTGENLKDQIDKADQDITALIKSSKGTSSESELEEVHKAFVADWQKSYEELQRQQLLKQKESQLRAIQRRFNAGSYSQVESTPFDIQRDKVLAQQDADIKKAYTRLNALSEMAKKDTRPFADKALDVRKQWLIATFSAIEKVAGSAITKPFIDAGNKQTFGRISGAITGIRPVDVGMVKDTFRQMKNSESAARFMGERNNAYVDALVNYEKTKAQHGEDAPQTQAALKAMQTAELKHAASLAYLYINAGSHIDIKQIMLNAATDLDASLAKYNKRYAGEMSKWEQVGYWLESVNRTHGAMKSVSARQALLDGYIENLQYFQKKGEPLDVDTRMKAWDMATLMEYEQGRFSEPTQLSNQVAKLKSHDNPWLRRPANFLIPVSKISINIAKQGIDRAIPLEFAWKHWGSNAIKGMKLNAEDGVEFSNFASKYYNGIQRGFNELPLEQKKYINTLMARGMAGLAQYALVGYLLSSGAIKYGGAYNDNDPFKKKYGQVTGADGQPLGNGEWEFGGHRAPKLLNAIINHSPYSMPASLAADLHWQVVRPDGKGNGAKVIGQVLNETYQRLPFATAVDLAKGTVFGDEYKLERTVANVLPTSKGAAELFDKDATTGEARKVDTQGDSFWSKVGKMAMQNTPGLRNLLPTKVAGGSPTTSRSSGRTTSRSTGRSSGRSQPRR
jgi:hypothetical protein